MIGRRRGIAGLLVRLASLALVAALPGCLAFSVFGDQSTDLSLTLLVDEGQVVSVRALCGGNEVLGWYLGVPIKDAGWCYANTRSEAVEDLDERFLDRE